MSGRMEVAGNPWLEAWNNAKPVPARSQKRLFDDTREAEKVGALVYNACNAGSFRGFK